MLLALCATAELKIVNYLHGYVGTFNSNGRLQRHICTLLSFMNSAYDMHIEYMTCKVKKEMWINMSNLCFPHQTHLSIRVPSVLITYSLLTFQMLFALSANFSPTTCFGTDPSFISFQCFIATDPCFIHHAILRRQFQQLLVCGGCKCCQWYVVSPAQSTEYRFSSSPWRCCSYSHNEGMDEISVRPIWWQGKEIVSWC